MRIALFSDNFYPELSGISDSVISLAKNLGARGHVVRFFVPEYTAADYAAAGAASPAEPDLGPNVSFERLSSLPYHVTGTGHARFVIPTGFRAASVKKFAPNVIHTQLFFGVGLEAVIASRELGIPLVGTNHTAMKEFLKYSPIKAHWLDQLLLDYVNWYYERCVSVTAPSKSVFDEMIELGFKHDDTNVVPNPIDTKTFHPAMAKARTALKKKMGFDGPVIIHAGRLSDERHPDAVIRALALVRKAVPGATLAFAGKGSSEEKLRILAKAQGVGDAVKFLGFLSQPGLNDAYNASDVFAIASTSDTQSMVMMQAMASGLPIVGVRARGIPEYVNDKNGFLVEPGDEKAFADKIIGLLKKPLASRRLGASARKYVEQFSEAAVAERWEGIYKDAIVRYNGRKA